MELLGTQDEGWELAHVFSCSVPEAVDIPRAQDAPCCGELTSVSIRCEVGSTMSQELCQLPGSSVHACDGHQCHGTCLIVTSELQGGVGTL